jgi:serine/threonine protein kinase
MTPEPAEPTLRLAPEAIRATISDRYELIAQLGSGGMARIFLALQRSQIASKLVVVKELRPELVDDDAFRTMFLDEARIALGLAHPNVISSFEVIAEGQQYCLVMEYLEGRSLGQLLRQVGRTRMPLLAHIWLLTEVLNGLHYSHELADLDGTPLRMVHRDVSPSNVFITRRGEVKLLDFGIAKAAGAIAQTRLGTLKGKLGYASPEQLMGEAIDARSDIYAVGVLLWEALAERRRVVAETPAAMMQARLQNLELPLSQVRSGLPSELLAITERALAWDPEERFPTAEAMRVELLKFLSSRSVVSEQTELAKLIQVHFAAQLAETKTAVEQAIANRGKSKAPLAKIEEPRELDTSTPRSTDRSGLEVIGRRSTPLPRVVAALAVGTAAVLGFLYGGKLWNNGSPQPSVTLNPLLGPMASLAGKQFVAIDPVAAPQVASADVKSDEPAAERRTPASARGHRRNYVAPPPAPEVPSVVKPPPVEKGAEPGMDLRGDAPKGRKRNLDEEDPFAP